MRPVDYLFPTMGAMRDMGLCPICGIAVNPGDFRDVISLKEFDISGMCQKCQDDFFSDPFGQ